jgi:hypothetical protein
VAFLTVASGWVLGIRSAREYLQVLTILWKCLKNQGAKGFCQGLFAWNDSPRFWVPRKSGT